MERDTRKVIFADNYGLVNLRMSPNSHSDVVKKIPTGEVLEPGSIIDHGLSCNRYYYYNEEYYRVVYGGSRGFVKSEFVCDLDAVPVVSDAQRLAQIEKKIDELQNKTSNKSDTKDVITKVFRTPSEKLFADEVSNNLKDGFVIENSGYSGEIWWAIFLKRV